jgi:hypothetical protein
MSDRWIELVKPVATAAAQQTFQGASVTPLGPRTETPPKLNLQKEEPYTKPSKTTPNLLRNDQQQSNPKTHEPSNSPKTNPTKGSHQSDQSRALVRPVMPGQLGMNRAYRSTPPKPTPDLLIRSTDSHKTLRIVGTTHKHSIAKLWSTKTR